MSETPARSRVRDHLDPILIRQIRRIAWVWLGLFVACAAVFQAIAVQLSNPIWFVLTGGRTSGPSVHAFLPIHLQLISWSSALVFVVWALISRQFTRPTRAWPMVVLIVLGFLGADFFGALTTSALLQLGRDAMGESAALHLLAGPGMAVAVLSAIAATSSLIVIPGLLASARQSRRRRGTNAS